MFLNPETNAPPNKHYVLKTEYRGMVSMVAHRSPKPFVRVRVLLPLPKTIAHLLRWAIVFILNEGLEHDVPNSAPTVMDLDKNSPVDCFLVVQTNEVCAKKVLLPLPVENLDTQIAC